MKSWYPLRFEPIYKQYLWGGHRLRTVLGRPLPPDQIYAESWEICDHDADQSVVSNGPWAGKTLHELVAAHAGELLGPAGLRAVETAPVRRFPLLLKYLDARVSLSVQVHPDAEAAAKLDPPDLAKTEAWLVVAAEPKSLIYAGLRPGVDRPTLAAAIQNGTCQECLNAFGAQSGDWVFLPAGTVHALGEGILVAEIQQSSDTTFRLFDWNRVGPDGKARPLHIEQGLDATHFDAPEVAPLRCPIGEQDQSVALVQCDAFVLRRHVLSTPKTLAADEGFHVLTVLDGAVELEGEPTGQPLVRGQSALLSAAGGPVRATPKPRAVLFDACLPYSP